MKTMRRFVNKLLSPITARGLLSLVLASVGLYGEQPIVLDDGSTRLACEWLWEQDADT